jgi:hypothetical protein
VVGFYLICSKTSGPNSFPLANWMIIALV